VLYPGRELAGLDPPAPGVTPESFGGKAAALGWLRAEHQVLLKVTELAAEGGFDEHAWRLPAVLWTFHNVCGHWHEGARAGRIALAAARRRGDAAGEAFALRGLGSFAMSLGDYGAAHDYLSGAKEIFAARGDRLGLARTEVILGQALEYQGRYGEALVMTRDALRLSSSGRAGQGGPGGPGGPDGPDGPDPGDGRSMSLVRASALNGSAWNSMQLGDLSTARSYCLQAIELCQAIGYSPGEAGTWDTLGVVWQRLGDHAAAVDCFLRAVTLDREMGNRYDLAMVLAHLGDTYASTFDGSGARAAWEESADILEGLHHPAAGDVRGKLASLPTA